jgi:hypothetical protein
VEQHRHGDLQQHGAGGGQQREWTLTVKVDASYAAASLANTASIATQTTTDPDTSAASNSSTVTVAVQNAPI